MTKVAKKVIHAWENGKSCNLGNTRTDGKVVWLFNNPVIKREGKEVFIRTAGFPSKTTKDRLNCIDKVQVYTHKGILYLNGKYWEDHERWTKVK